MNPPDQSNVINPVDAGFYMPAEWAPHSCTWMAWPSRDGLWSNDLATRQAYANVANTIARFEPVKMLVPPSQAENASNYLGENVEIIEMQIDDSWARDSGPNFLINDKGELAGSDWRFNGWGDKYHPYDQDALMASRILEKVNAMNFSSEMSAEGGGITVDGEGTIITTESCFLNPNRNPGWSKQEVEVELCRTLGAEKVIWIPGDVNDTETDGHIDGIAAFVEPGVVLVEVEADQDDPYYSVGQENTHALRDQTDAKGRSLHLEFINSGSYADVITGKDCRSYINSYLANGAVIVPGYDHERDEKAVETYRHLYPDREIVQVQIKDIAEGGGGIHCITQQQPEVFIS